MLRCPGSVTATSLSSPEHLHRTVTDLDQDGDVDKADVRKITPALAEEIFVKNYFDKPGIAQLPEPLQASVFDMYVNAGSNAVRILQRLLARMGFDVSVDGRIGPQTVKITQAALSGAPGHLVDAYGIARRNYYYAIGDRRPASRKYARRRNGSKGGWITRAEEFISPRFHLSENEHSERVSSWA